MIRKQIICALLLLCTGAALKAQDKTAGVIYFKQTTYFKGQPGAGQMVMNGSAMSMPDKLTGEYEMLFNSTDAKYQKSFSETPAPATGGGMVMNVAGADRKVFFSFAENKITEYFPFDGDSYLMQNKLGANSDTVQKTDETKTIIGYNCKKAIVKYKGVNTEVWYTTDLKFNASPSLPYWTEGVVLALKNPRVEYEATSVEYYKVKDSEFKLPKDGKPITADEFKAKQEAMIKKMQENGGRVMRFGN